MMPATIAAHGKFLLTGEYLVLEGARALAVPLTLGQQLEITPRPEQPGRLRWESYEYDRCWFSMELDLASMQIINSTDTPIAERLLSIFLEARKLNSGFINNYGGLYAKIRSDFNLQWGLGSSSTLIYALARWAEVDPYLLLEKTFGGSGYDIACAGSSSALFYTLHDGKPTVEPTRWVPEYADQIYFVYLGAKMNSRTGMAYFRKAARFTSDDLQRISDIGEAWIAATTIEQLEGLITEHESRMSAILQLPAVKPERFPDYPFAIKSLGAWGGDFVLATGRDPEAVNAYFGQKGLNTIFSFRDMIRG